MRLPPGLPEGSPIEITFELNEQGRLEMRARELTGGREAQINLQTEAIMSPEQVADAVQHSTRITVS